MRELVFVTIDIKKLSEILWESIYVDTLDTQNIITDSSRLLYTSTHESVYWNNLPQEKQNLLIKWYRESLLPMLEENIPKLHERSTQIREETHRYHEQRAKNEALIILNVINNNVSNLPNSDMRNIIHSSIWYDKMAEVLQRWIYQNHYTTLDIWNNVDLMIDYTLQQPRYRNQEIYELLRTWINDYLINDLVKTTPLELGSLDALFG